MTLEEAIQQANALVARQREEGPDAVTDGEIKNALDAIRSARSTATAGSKRGPSEPVDLDALFG